MGFWVADFLFCFSECGGTLRKIVNVNFIILLKKLSIQSIILDL